MEGARRPIRLRIMTHRNSAISLALCKAIFIVTWHVPMATDYVILMPTKNSISTTWLANTNAVFSDTHKVGPFVDLLAKAVGATRPNIGKDEASVWVSSSVCTVWVQLSSCIPSSNVNVLKVTCSGYLDVVWRFDKMGRDNRAVPEEACSPVRTRAIRDDGLLDGANLGGGLWTPETEILNAVNPDVLAEARLVVASSTLIRSSLIAFSGRREIRRVVCSSVALSGDTDNSGHQGDHVR